MGSFQHVLGFCLAYVGLVILFCGSLFYFLFFKLHSAD